MNDFPYYTRSPRIIKRQPQDSIALAAPPEKEKAPKNQLLKTIVPPIVMLAGTIGASMMMDSGLYMLAGAAVTMVTTIFTITTYFEERKELKIRNATREKAYEEYLLDIRKKIYKLYTEQKEALLFNNPSVKSVELMVQNYSSRLFERSGNDGDFLNICVGLGKKKGSFKISNPLQEFRVDSNSMLEDAKELYKRFEKIPDMPVTIDLKQAHLGLVGSREVIHEQLKLLIAQITFQQSYHDVELILLVHEKDQKEFEYVKWYPHFTIHSVNVTGFVHSERVRDQVLGSVAQILKERKLNMEEEKKETRYLPHFIFIIDEPELIINHSIMEYLQTHSMDFGFSLIYTTHLRANLPENVKTIVELDDSNHGELFMECGTVKEKKMMLNRLEDVDLETMARNLSPICHVQGMKSRIPDSVTFFGLFHVNRPEELDIKKRWQEHAAYKTLAVPLGLRSEGDIVELNLHEKAHGPHGLVAGTTGSGKSEIIQSYILSLAVNFHPHEVGFLLIDYKGGGMAGLFEKLPHLLGTITNLDGAESMRAMASIKSELSRRQNIFKQYHVNHIDQYMKLFKKGDATEPLPHLFLISDEFAELKKEQPDFMTELVSAARIGRSLGVHLILATQKPSGVVDDQIWTNSRFKLALKVADTQDSQEILKTPDAAAITKAGRAYLQVGNNEIYELFQSAFSGAPGQEEGKETGSDDRVYLINDLGQGELLNQDLGEKLESGELKRTQLDVTVDHIAQLYQNINAAPVSKTWLPSLPAYLPAPSADKEIIDLAQYQELDLRAEIGLIDIPEEQKQESYCPDLLKEGNHIVFAGPGYGKSMFLTTVAMSLAIKNSPENLQFYMLDFGNSSLMPLKNLPHTADYFTYDDLEKIYKFESVIEEEIRFRKHLLAEVGAVNYEMYQQMESKEKLPAIILFIDNYDVVRELDDELEDFFARLTRDGISLGIITIITATGTNAARYALLKNFKRQMAMYMFDSSEITAIVGRTDYPLGEIPGRGLMKFEHVNQLQIYTAVSGKTPMEYTENLQNRIQCIRNGYTGKLPKGIPMLPDVLTVEELKEQADTQSVYRIPIGLDAENVEVQYMDLSEGIQLIIGNTKTGKTNLLVLILNYLLDNAEIYLVDSKELALSAYQDQVVYIKDQENFDDALDDLKEIVDERKNEYEDAREEDTSLLPRTFYGQLKPIVLLVEDCDQLVEFVERCRDYDAVSVIKSLYEVGIYLVGTTHTKKLADYGETAMYLKSASNGVILMHPSEQSIIDLPYEATRKTPVDRGYQFKNGEVVEIKIPKAD